MHTDRAITRMSSDQVGMRPIVNRMTDASESITFGNNNGPFLKKTLRVNKANWSIIADETFDVAPISC